MIKFQNMKIEINEQQPLNEVVAELEVKGYVSEENKPEDDDKCIIVIDGKYFGWWHGDNWSIETITLAQLKEMK